jgi:hypothetical protein
MRELCVGYRGHVHEPLAWKESRQHDGCDIGTHDHVCIDG